MAELNNTSDISTLLSNYQKGRIDSSIVPDIDFAKGDQKPMIDLVGMTMAGPLPIVEYNNENKFLEAAERGWGQSRFDRRVGYQSDRDIEDLRANEQSWVGKITNGLLKGGVTTLTTAANSTIGLLNGLGSSVFELGKEVLTDKDFNVGDIVGAGVNNKFSENMIRLQEQAEEWFPNYRTEEERTDEYQSQFLRPSHFFSGNFLGDSLIKNFGFTLGAMGGGMAWNKLIGLGYAKKLSSDLMKGAIAAADGDQNASKMLREAAEAIQRGRNVGGVDTDMVMKNIKTAGKTLKNAQLSTQLLGALTAAMGEGTAEGLMAKDEFLEEFTPKMNREYAEAYNSLESILYKEHPEWFAMTLFANENGNPVQTPILVSDEGKQELYRRQLDLSDKFRKTQEYAETQGDVLAKTTFLLNLPILMSSDLIQFGRMFGGDWTTARRNAPKVKGKLGNYTDAVGNTALRAALRSVEMGATEGAEEMLQGFVSSGAKNIADTRLTYFKDMGYDEEAMKKASDGMYLLFQGGKDYLGDAKNWQEGVVGAITGLFGIPGRRWNGGVAEAIQQTRAEKQASQEAADKLNQLVNSEQFQNNWRGYIRHMAYDDQMLKAAEKNDSYAWHKADGEQLINDVLTFANSGRIEDLKDFVDSIATINDTDSASIDDIRNFLRGTNEKENIELASKPNSEIINSVKKQADRMKRTIDDYYEVFSDLANISPEDINTDKFKEMMFTSMQLRGFEDRFAELLDDTLAKMKPYFEVKAAFKTDGSAETDSDVVEQRLETLQSQFRNAFAGNIRKNSVLDYITEGYINNLLDSTEEEIKKQKTSNPGTPAVKLQTALDSVRQMRKIADSRRELLRKLVGLRNMTNEKYEEEALNDEKVVTKAEEVQAARDTSKLRSVMDINVELAKRQEGDERNDYYESLKKSRNKNKAIDEFFKIEELGSDIAKVSGKVFKENDLSGAESEAAAFIIQYIGDNAPSEEAMLNMDENLIPTEEQVINSIRSMATFRNISSDNTLGKMARESVYNNALKAVTAAMNEVRKTRGMTKATKVRATDEFAFDSVPEGQLPKGKSSSDKKPVPIPPSDTPEGLDPPTPATVVKTKDVTAGNINGTPRNTFSETDIDISPVVEAPTPIVKKANEVETVSMISEENVSNESSVPMDTVQKRAESGSSENERDNYNMSVPEMSPEDTRSKIENAKDGIFYNGEYRTLPEEDERYKDTWDLLNDKYNAFNNADLVRPGDDVYFFIDPTNENYDGEPQILIGIKVNGEPKIFNILRKNVNPDNVFDSWRGLSELRSEIISEYQDRAADGTSMFEFSKSSKVWVRQPGFIVFNKDDSPISSLMGFSEDATIFSINIDGTPIILSGNSNRPISNMLPDSFKERISNLMSMEGKQRVVGNLYYLANGVDNSYIPIRLNVEHFREDNKQSDGYGFDNIRNIADKLANLSHQFTERASSIIERTNNETYINDSARNEAISKALDEMCNEIQAEKTKLVQDLSAVLDLHGVIITYGFLKRQDGLHTPTLRLGVYKDIYDADGNYMRGELDNKVDFESDLVSSEDIVDWLAGLNRSFNVGFPNETKKSKIAVANHIKTMATSGLLTSNADTMRSRGIDIYIDSFNPETRQFDSLHEARNLSESIDKSSTAILSEGSVKEAEIQTPEIISEQKKIEESNADSQLYKFEELSQDTKKAFEHQGITAEIFDVLPLDVQEEMLHCYN